jgi:hypothetical protein
MAAPKATSNFDAISSWLAKSSAAKDGEDSAVAAARKTALRMSLFMDPSNEI